MPRSPFFNCFWFCYLDFIVYLILKLVNGFCLLFELLFVYVIIVFCFCLSGFSSFLSDYFFDDRGVVGLLIMFLGFEF